MKLQDIFEVQNLTVADINIGNIVRTDKDDSWTLSVIDIDNENEQVQVSTDPADPTVSRDWIPIDSIVAVRDNAVSGEVQGDRDRLNTLMGDMTT